MNIRIAEPRDVSQIEDLFHELLEYLVKCGQWLYAQDEKKFRNGVAGFIIGKMFNEQSLVLVMEDEAKIRGFLIGGLMHYPEFFEHTILGEVQWLYPLSIKECPTYSRMMSWVFDNWAKKQGATAGSNYSLPGNGPAQRLMKHDGRKIVFNYHVKPYGQEGQKCPIEK